MQRYIFTILLALLTLSSPAKPLKLLYWNIQNGMWADQENNYDNFIKFVNEQAPDICVWCEAKSLYYSGTDKGFKEEMERFLPSNWDVLAARYGHRFVYLGGYRDNYPQVITSRYPIRNVQRLVGTRPDSVVAHGSGWAQIDIKGKTYNIVTLHTWPHKHRYEAKANEIQESRTKCEGDYYRKMELEYICKHTILTHPQAEKELWLMMGDFNTQSRVDNYYYHFPSDTTLFLTHDFIKENTPYRDAVAEKHPDNFQSTTENGKRIDFIYASPAMMQRISKANVIREGFAKNRKINLSNFCLPSDHLPILIEFK